MKELKIYVKNVYSILSDYTEELEKVLTIPYENYWFSNKYKQGLWDGRYHFLKIKAGYPKFATGLRTFVEKFFNERNTNYKIIDERKVPEWGWVDEPPITKFDDAWLYPPREPFLKGIELRDYQWEAIVEALKEKRGIIELATGLGKTEIAIGITKILGLRTLFLTHTQDLLHQTANRFKKRLAVEVGLIGDSEFEIEPDIIVATVQSLYSLLKKNTRAAKEILNSFQVMFQDECISGDSLILLPGNEVTTIREIYDNPFISEVMSYNEETKILEPRKILRKIKGVLRGKNFKKFQFRTDKATFLKITGNHEVWTNQGYKQIQELNGSEVLKVFENNNVKQVYICKLCGKKFYDQQHYRNHNSFACLAFREKAYRARSLNLNYRKYLSNRIKGKNSLPKKKEPKKVLAYKYNLEVEGNHNYIANGLLISNCHHSSAMTFYTIGMYMHNAYYRYGLSGTIMRRDKLSNMKVMALTGKVIYSKLSEEGIKEGYLSNIEIEVMENDEEVFGKNWQAIYEDGIVRSAKRNSEIMMLAKYHLQKGDKIMILIRRIEHGKILERMLADRGIPCYFLYGQHESWQRNRIKHKFNKKGEFVLIASVGIFGEGVDIPTISVLIIGAGGKSEVQVIQWVGRGLRPESGVLKVYDFIDKSKYLNKHSQERIKVYKKEKWINSE